MFRSDSANSLERELVTPLQPAVAVPAASRRAVAGSPAPVMMWRSLRIGAVLAGALLVPQLAFAQEPCGDELCPAGFECQVSEAGCAGPCYETPEGEWYCEPGECESETYYNCVRAHCESDADCGPDMLCHIQQVETCPPAPLPGLACPPGSECPPVEAPPEAEADCTTSDVSSCAYPHELPCETDEHCGAGFECVPTEICWCSGAAPAPITPDGAPPGPPPEPECGCEQTGENHCEVIEVACASDADCLEGWSCLEHGGACWQAPDGSSGCDEGEWRCTPPSFGGAGAPGSVGGESEPNAPVTPPTGAGGAIGMLPSPGVDLGSDPGPSPVPSTPPPAADEPGAGTVGAGVNDLDDGAIGNPPPHPPRASWARCSAASVGVGAAGPSLWSLALAALGLGLTRRRRR